ncbi:MAG: transposase [Candidatus Cloacimonetes bacterium]|nr:transposase [Candidatus Cloacimonadota bacterium]
MRCKKEDFMKGTYFHIYNHAVNKELLFRERNDYLYFLKKINKYLPSCPVSIISYCLMPNHFHFFIKQKTDIPAYKLFNLISVAFIRHMNTKYHRIGTIFRGKLNHKKVDKENYLIYL